MANLNFFANAALDLEKFKFINFLIDSESKFSLLNIFHKCAITTQNPSIFVNKILSCLWPIYFVSLHIHSQLFFFFSFFYDTLLRHEWANRIAEQSIELENIQVNFSFFAPFFPSILTACNWLQNKED